MLIHKISGWRAMPNYVCLCNEGPGKLFIFLRDVERFNDSCERIYKSELWPNSKGIAVLSKNMKEALDELSGIIKEVK